MTIKHLYPAVEPSLNLDFANSRKLDSRITFTRASTGTYLDPETQLITTAAANEARIEKEGLLIEESRTNSWTYSEQPSQSPWTQTNITVTENNVTSPDGNLTGALLSSSSSGTNYVYQTHVENVPTFTIYAKAGTTGNLWVRLQSNVVGRNVAYNFNLSDSTFSAATGNTGNLSGWTERKSITNAGNGWYRIEVGFSSSTGTVTTDYQISPSIDGSADASGETVYIWGAQLEKDRTFPTSYIPTSGSTVTRSADVASMTGTNFSSWYNTAQSTWYAEVDQLYINSSGNQEGVSSIFADRYSNTGPQRWREYSWRGTQGSTTIIPAFNTPVTPEGSTAKVALAIDGVNAKMCVHGVLSSTGALGAYPGTAELRIGISPRLLDNWVGHVARLTYWPYRLTDAQLEALTL